MIDMRSKVSLSSSLSCDGRCCSIRRTAGVKEDERLCDREKWSVVIDDKDQPLDDKNSGFGGNAERIIWTVMG